MVNYIRVLYNEYTEVTRVADSDDEWNRDDTSTTYSIGNVRVVPEREWFDFPVGFTPERGESYWLVYVVYSTGDSFGYDENGGIEFIDLYRTLEEAQAVVDAIEENDRGANEYSIPIRNSVGDEYNLSCSAWTGYFENLTYAEARQVTVE